MTAKLAHVLSFVDDVEAATAFRFAKLTQEAKQRIEEISSDELVQLREHERVILVDVREESEWAQGHIPSAIHIPRGVIELKIAEAVPDPEARVVVYCGGGGRSALAADSLQNLGYTRVASLANGFRGWRQGSRPIEGEAK